MLGCNEPNLITNSLVKLTEDEEGAADEACMEMKTTKDNDSK